MEWNGNGMELKWKHSSDKVYMIVYRKWKWSRKKNEEIFDIMDILSEKQNGISVEW